MKSKRRVGGSQKLIVAVLVGCLVFGFLRTRQRVEEVFDETGSLLVIYEQYHSIDAHDHLHNASALYRALNQAEGCLRPNAPDLDATALLEIATNTYYQNLLCEYTGILAIAAHARNLHPHPWIGFQSWRAADKGFAIQPAAEESLLKAIQSRAYGDALYFWSDGGFPGEHIPDFYGHCDFIHEHCSEVFAKVTQKVLGRFSPNPDAYQGAPPMPVDGGTYAFMSYFVLPTKSLIEYTAFAKAAVVALDDMFFYAHKDGGFCIMAHGGGGADAEYESRHCYCYILERLVNVWAYQTGRRMIYVDAVTGNMEEQHPLHNRTIWKEWFQPPHFQQNLQYFEADHYKNGNDRKLLLRLNDGRAALTSSK